MKSKEELKKLFENGDKPTQENFWEWQDSYWHKDEKLPTDNAGLYKIKGSVPDLTTLHFMSNISEGDVYNLLDTGDNYVYVLDLDSTGLAGWDKLSGIIDLSAINLQTVLDNGSYANDKSGSSLPSEMNLNLPLKTINWSLWGENASSTSSFVHDVNKLAGEVLNNGSFVGFNADSSLSHVRLYAGKQSMKSEVALKHDTALTYLADYSSKFIDRSLVDKAYVDNATSTLNYLPLSGTEVGKPLIGNVALSYANFISGSGDYQSRLEFVGDSSELFSSTPMFTNSVRVSSDAVVLRSDDLTGAGNSSEVYVRTGLIRIRTNGIGARGLTGDDDYTANITALDYVQKKYVDDAIANSTTPIEEIVLAGSNGLTGKIRYEKRGEFMNIHVDITVGELQVDESFSTILPFDLKTSFIVHPMITDIANYFYTDIIIKTDGNNLLFINKTDAVITGGLIKQSFVFALGAD